MMLSPVYMSTHPRKNLLIVPSVGIQEARELISSWLANFAVPAPARLAGKNLSGLTVIAALVIWYIIAQRFQPLFLSSGFQSIII